MNATATLPATKTYTLINGVHEVTFVTWRFYAELTYRDRPATRYVTGVRMRVAFVEIEEARVEWRRLVASGFEKF